MKISSSIDIRSTPEVVFGWLSRPEKAMEWMTSVSRTEILEEKPGLVGTAFREVVQDESGALEMRGVVTACEPPRSISFRLASRLNALDVTYCVELAPGGVRLTEEADVRWKFPVSVYSLLFGQRLRRGVLAQLQDEFNKLKALCEAPVTQP
jgi:uncharacterized protein YndB with AHSA1/START domain